MFSLRNDENGISVTKSMYICLGTDILLKTKIIIFSAANPVRCLNDNGGGWGLGSGRNYNTFCF